MSGRHLGTPPQRESRDHSKDNGEEEEKVEDEQIPEEEEVHEEVGSQEEEEEDEQETPMNYGKTCDYKKGEEKDSKMLGGAEESVEEPKVTEEESDEVVAIYSRGRHDSSKGLERYYLSMEGESKREEEFDSEVLERYVTSEGERAAVLTERDQIKQRSSDTEQANEKGSGQSEEVVEVFEGNEEVEEEEEAQKDDSVEHHVSESAEEDAEEVEVVERMHNRETPKAAEESEDSISMKADSQDEGGLRESSKKQEAELSEQGNDEEYDLETDVKADLGVNGEEEDSDILERCVMSERNVSRGGKSGEESDILERCVSANISDRGESEEVVERFLKGKDEKVLETDDAIDYENDEEEEEDDEILEMSVKFDEEDPEEDSEQKEVIEKFDVNQEMSSSEKESSKKEEVNRMHIVVQSPEEVEMVEQEEGSEIVEIQPSQIKEHDDNDDDDDDDIEKNCVGEDYVKSQEDELVKDVQQEIEPVEERVETESKDYDSDEEILEICARSEEQKDRTSSEKGSTQSVKEIKGRGKESEKSLSFRPLGKARASPRSPVLASSEEDSGKDQASESKEEAVEELHKGEERARSVIGGGQKEIPFMSLPRTERMGKLLTVQRTILPNEVGALC